LKTGCVFNLTPLGCNYYRQTPCYIMQGTLEKQAVSEQGNRSRVVTLNP
jgi:hypothetical protein